MLGAGRAGESHVSNCGVRAMQHPDPPSEGAVAPAVGNSVRSSGTAPAAKRCFAKVILLPAPPDLLRQQYKGLAPQPCSGHLSRARVLEAHGAGPAPQPNFPSTHSCFFLSLPQVLIPGPSLINTSNSILESSPRTHAVTPGNGQC